MLVLGAVVGLCWAQAGLHPTRVLVFGAAVAGGLQALPGQREEKTEHPTFVLVLGAVVGLCWAQAGPRRWRGGPPLGCTPSSTAVDLAAGAEDCR